MLAFIIRSGKIYLSKVQIATGYSGHDEYKNDPSKQSIHGLGPLPVGKYTKCPAYDHPKVGKLAMPLVPWPGQEMYGRTELFWHGDSVKSPGTASHGCIISDRTSRVKVNEADEIVHVFAEEADYEKALLEASDGANQDQES